MPWSVVVCAAPVLCMIIMGSDHWFRALDGQGMGVHPPKHLVHLLLDAGGAAGPAGAGRSGRAPHIVYCLRRCTNGAAGDAAGLLLLLLFDVLHVFLI